MLELRKMSSQCSALGNVFGWVKKLKQAKLLSHGLWDSTEDFDADCTAEQLEWLENELNPHFNKMSAMDGDPLVKQFFESESDAMPGRNLAPCGGERNSKAIHLIRRGGLPTSKGGI